MELFTSQKMTAHITKIRGAASELMYLVEGTEAAVLIDTGCGIGYLKEYVDTLTDKSVSVVLTHGHVDHASGTDGFSQIYMNPKDEDVYRLHTSEEFIWRGLELMMGKARFENIRKYIRVPKQCITQPLTEGMQFDLGGVSLEIFSAAGHTKGSMAILIPEERILVIGDACTANTLVYSEYSLVIEAYLHSMEQLCEKVDGRYDTMFFSHGSGISSTGFIESVIEVCREILERRDDAIPFLCLGEETLLAKDRDFRLKRLDGGLANVVYRPERIWENN